MDVNIQARKLRPLLRAWQSWLHCGLVSMVYGSRTQEPTIRFHHTNILFWVESSPPAGPQRTQLALRRSSQFTERVDRPEAIDWSVHNLRGVDGSSATTRSKSGFSEIEMEVRLDPPEQVHFIVAEEIEVWVLLVVSTARGYLPFLDASRWIDGPPISHWRVKAGCYNQAGLTFWHLNSKIASRPHVHRRQYYLLLETLLTTKFWARR